MDYPKVIMIVGNGGRECALANACLLSPRVERLVITPPNWGVLDPQGGGRVTTLEIKVGETDRLIAAAKEQAAELVIVGPEDPLCAGLADEFRHAGFPVVGPGRDGARLEGSKLFAKQFMENCGIPTAAYREFTEARALLDYCENLSGPVVLKGDGLAAGKGVIVCEGKDDALAAAKRLMVDREFGAAGDTVVAEQKLVGPEISWTVLVAAGQAGLLGVSTDYKPLLDGNKGPNTGGMGNICPTPYATEEITREFHDRILTPFMLGLKAEELDYRGFLFIGTMLTGEGLKVLEFNVRIGDPEAQVVLPMNNADWPLVFAMIAGGELDTASIRAREGACVAISVASGNYPYSKSEPAVIEGFDRVHDRGLLVGETKAGGNAVPGQVALYFAGVSREAAAEAGGAETGYRNYYANLDNYRYLATGGRVLAVSAHGANLSDARRLAYEVTGNLRFEGMQFRSDIGKAE